MSQGLRFIRKNGKIIPIRAEQSGATSTAHHAVKIAKVGAAAVGAVAIKNHGQIKPKNPAIKVNRALDITGLGLSIASGALAAATFSTPKGLALGHAAAKAIDVGGVSANIASVAGRGHTKDRAIQATKQEARNFAVGNAVFAAGVLGIKKNREAAIKYSAKAVGYAKKILDFGKKAMRIV